jgi:hypothetical protein
MKGNTLGELVKCKSSKNIFQTNFPEKPDISAFLIGFERHLPDMSGPLQFLRVNQAYLCSMPGSNKVYQTCPAPGPDMFGQAFLCID